MDLGSGDLSTLAFPEWNTRQATADVVARAPGVVAGIPLIEVVWEVLGRKVQTTGDVADAEQVSAGDKLMTCSGPAAALLAGERTLLNVLSHLSGIATLTAAYVQACEGTSARICDTRKTLPGLRTLQKYAVRCGGGVNHRFSLADAVMLKDNHQALLMESLESAIHRIRQRIGPTVRIEVEVDTIAGFRTAATCGVDVIMLDNMDLAMIAQCVKERPNGTLLEVSGGVRLEQVALVAALGVDYISVGRLTHSAPALDLALDFAPA